MSTKCLIIPVKKINNEDWGQLSFFGTRHEFCGEKIWIKDEKFSFVGGHRVRLCRAEGNVHWRIPQGVPLDISRVAPAGSPRRLQKQ